MAGRQHPAGLGGPRTGQCAASRRCRGTAAVYGAGARCHAGTDRALPGRPAVAGADGRDLPTRGGPGGALEQGQSGAQWRRGRQEGRQGKLGRQCHVAGRLSQCPGDDEQGTRMDAETGRCLPRAAEGGAGRRTAPAPTGQEQRQPREQPAAGGAHRGPVHHHRAGAAANDLRPGLQSDGGLWRLAVSRVPALLLSGRCGLVSGNRAAHRPCMGRGLCRRRRDVWQLQLGPRRRECQRQPRHQHQQ